MLACLDEALFRFEVIVAVRHAQAARAEIRDDLRRIVQVLLANYEERHTDAEIMQLTDHVLHVGFRLDRAHLIEKRLYRLHAELVDLRFVHARRVEVAGKLFGAAGRPVLAR